MPTNRNALIRYKTIDKCLQNRSRKWTLNDLIDACSDALYEYEGISDGVSMRTTQLDIQMMRSDKLGYAAPIIVYDRKYYTYADSNYSIHNIPISDQDLFLLKDIVATLQQFQSFEHFRTFGGIIKKLEDQLHVKGEHLKPIIDFDKNTELKGQEFINPLYEAITQRQVVSMSYQSFRAKQANDVQLHPQFLKEFNNRWFVIGVRHRGDDIKTFALDRIHALEISNEGSYVYLDIDPEEYYKNVIGVTVHKNQRTDKVIFRVDHKNAPYIMTKPFHKSQCQLYEEKNWTTFQIEVQINKELERLLLGFGESLEVLKPRRLKNRMRKAAAIMMKHYQT